MFFGISLVSVPLLNLRCKRSI